MNAIDLLKADHRYVDMLFTRIESTPPSRHMPIFKKILGEMQAHQHVEETIFYPTLIEKGNKELQDITREGIEEHGQMKKFLQEIGRASTSTEKREAKLKVLIEDTRHHVKEEEGEMFSLVEDQFSAEQLEDLGQRMEAEKVKFQKAKAITPRKEEAPTAVGVMVEKAKQMVSSMLGGGSEEEESGSVRNGKKSTGNGPRTGVAKARGGTSKTTAAKGSNGSSKARASTAKSASDGSRAKSSNGSSKAKASNGSSKSGSRSSASSGSKSTAKRSGSRSAASR